LGRDVVDFFSEDSVPKFDVIVFLVLETVYERHALRKIEVLCPGFFQMFDAEMAEMAEIHPFQKTFELRIGDAFVLVEIDVVPDITQQLVLADDGGFRLLPKPLQLRQRPMQPLAQRRVLDQDVERLGAAVGDRDDLFLGPVDLQIFVALFAGHSARVFQFAGAGEAGDDEVDVGDVDATAVDVAVVHRFLRASQMGQFAEL